MTQEQINDTIKTEVKKRFPEIGRMNSHNMLAEGFVQATDWLLSKLSAWGYVKVPETDEELKKEIEECFYDVSVFVPPVLQDNDWSSSDFEPDTDEAEKSVLSIAQAYAAKEAVDFMDWCYKNHLTWSLSLGKWTSDYRGAIGSQIEDVYKQFKKETNEK